MNKEDLLKYAFIILFAIWTITIVISNLMMNQTLLVTRLNMERILAR